MIIGHENGVAVGNDRYGSRQNAVKYMCAGCGREYGPGQGNMGRCPSCGGTLQLMGPDSRDNADPIARRENGRAAGQERYGSVQNAAKCACGGPVNPRSRQPFMEPMCDECIAEEKQYAKGERDYERENADQKHEHDFKKVVETDGAHWFVCKGCGERMTVPKE